MENAFLLSIVKLYVQLFNRKMIIICWFDYFRNFYIFSKPAEPFHGRIEGDLTNFVERTKMWCMIMKLIEIIILDCLKKIQNERTVYSIFHLLKGKKSSQTIQDAHLFSLTNYYGILEPLTRESFDKIIGEMSHQEWINSIEEQRFTVSSKGERWLINHTLPEFLNGWNYHQLTLAFWERLSLFAQVVSNLVYQEKNYLPIQKNKDVHDWLKSVLKESRVPRQELGSMLYHELLACLDEANDLDPSVLVFRLTGYRQIGLTSKQAAQKLNMDPLDYHIAFINILHYMIQRISFGIKQFPLLTYLVKDLTQTDELTLSSRKTWNLIVQGHSPDVIANVRQLKISTIEDHLVECALHLEEFPIEDYVNENLQESILKAIQQSGTRRLKQIRNAVPLASYFQIRLVLAKFGEQQWN